MLPGVLVGVVAIVLLARSWRRDSARVSGERRGSRRRSIAGKCEQQHSAAAAREIGGIGLGCMGMTASYDLETPRNDATSIAVIRRAVDMGMTLIDTADAYGPFTNEELVGRALAGGA